MTLDIHHEIFVGREQEVARLRQVLLDLEALAPGSGASSLYQAPHCAMLTGTEGIGKTRVAEEAAHEAIGRGWEVLWTSVSGDGEEVPHHLWIAFLHQIRAHGLLPVQELICHPHLYSPLRALLPDIGTFLPPASDQAPASARQETGRLWEAMRALLATISARKPLLVVLDDLHQAGVSSLALLAFLVRHLHDQPILFLGTCGKGEWTGTHPLHGLLSDLLRDQERRAAPPGSPQ